VAGENSPAAQALALDPPPGEPPFPGMVWIPGGDFSMGSDEFYPEESPVRRATVAGFWIDRAPVTVREFRRFVKATAHVTAAEHAPQLSDYPDADPALLVPGSLVFQGTRGPVALDDSRAWWRYVPGARWDRPEGPTSHVYTRADHPVTHVALADAQAYAAWAGKALPTEAEWERAARGGLDGARFAWGDDELLGGRRMANTWQGEFPWRDTGEDGWRGTSPVGAYPPNDFGLLDITGNVWEWTADPYQPAAASPSPCCAPAPSDTGRFASNIMKGGSHLCAPDYCLRYRPAARQAETVDTSTSHIGFRCVVRTRT
jgi:formylglycine-generating enzyme required for sulfatase activity